MLTNATTQTITIRLAECCTARLVATSLTRHRQPGSPAMPLRQPAAPSSGPVSRRVVRSARQAGLSLRPSARLRAQPQAAAELACSRHAAAAARGAPAGPTGGQDSSGCIARAAQWPRHALSAPAQHALSFPTWDPRPRSLRSLGRAAGQGRPDAVPDVQRRWRGGACRRGRVATPVS